MAQIPEPEKSLYVKAIASVYAWAENLLKVMEGENINEK